uniref:Zinc finger, CCHC-type n=1 Tax=Tanacetum cinerariifolium TaxID=118510 RepID=A0A6L2JF92_TANCI|nr:zinc finger, CCHC-type [Tanacetum cinerariifolium]
MKGNGKNNETLTALTPILSVEDKRYEVVSSGWSFISAVPGQMTYPVASLTLDSASPGDLVSLLYSNRFGIGIPPRQGILGESTSSKFHFAVLGTVATRKYRLNLFKLMNETNSSFRTIEVERLAAHKLLSGGGVVDLTSNEDLIDEGRDTGVSDSEVSVSLGEIFPGGRKSRESNIGDSDNTEDGGKIVGGAIGACSRGIEILDSLEAKYMAEDAACKNFLAIQVSCIIDILPPSLKDFKQIFKHKKEETIVKLGSHLQIEESLKMNDSNKPKGNNVVGPLVVNVVEQNNSIKYNDNKDPEQAFVEYASSRIDETRDMYDSLKSRMELYMLNRQHGRMILESVEHGPLLWPSVEEDGVTRLKKYSELSAAEAIQADCDVKVTNIILQALPPEIYALVSTHKVANDLWERIQMLMQGMSLTKQERECKLYDEFDKFAYRKGETLRDFYLRFSLLLNDMNMYNMKLK